MSKASILKGKKYRQIYVKNEIKLLSYNYLVNNINVEKRNRCVLLAEKLKKAPKFSRTRLVNYCIKTGNPRWVFKKLHISRNVLKKAATLGTLVGFRKSS